MDDDRARELIAAMEGLLERVESLPDATARDTATRLAQALLELYGAGLERIIDHVAAADDGTLARAFADDELVAHLLLLHDLHPVPVEDRVRAALAEVRPYLDSHGGDVELLGVQDGVARLRLEGSCSGCPSSAATLELAIEDAIHNHAPDVAEVRAEETERAPGLLQIELVPAPSRPAWSTASGVPALGDGEHGVEAVAGEDVLFARLDGRFYAYRPDCPDCGASLGDAALDAGTLLRCGSCGHAFDVRHAGRCADAPELHLDPVPLLIGDDGAVRVALGSPA
jgi:Fe-S cluster biogenesis protein NfuA/nitrite reductase/ring-hydroxylating ferredoxin subunit